MKSLLEGAAVIVATFVLFLAGLIVSTATFTWIGTWAQ